MNVLARSLISKIARQDRFELVSILTLALLLLHAPKYWYVHGPLVVLCIAGLAFHQLRQHWKYWFLLFAFLSSSVAFNWATADNHKYLECYWVLAMACVVASSPPQRQRLLGWNARMLIGLCMLFATAWKLVSPTYVSGAFFEYALLTDSRFEHLAEWLGDIPLSTAKRNHLAEKVLTTGHLDGLDVREATLKMTSRVKVLAQVLTWWTVIIEGILAAVFLIPGGHRWRVLRNLLLLIFAATTYLVATVKGFGWLLVIMGIAQCEEDDDLFVPAYLLVFFAIQIYTMPYAEVGAALISNT